VYRNRIKSESQLKFLKFITETYRQFANAYSACFTICAKCAEITVICLKSENNTKNII